jgi:P-type E1-E2 ATPase
MKDESGSEYEVTIDIALLQKNDVCKIFPGEKIPSDGIIIKGKSSIDESMITGESISIIKNVGDKVIGGLFFFYILNKVQSIWKEFYLSKLQKLEVKHYYHKL